MAINKEEHMARGVAGFERIAVGQFNIPMTDMPITAGLDLGLWVYDARICRSFVQPAEPPPLGVEISVGVGGAAAGAAATGAQDGGATSLLGQAVGSALTQLVPGARGSFSATVTAATPGGFAFCQDPSDPTAMQRVFVNFVATVRASAGGFLPGIGGGANAFVRVTGTLPGFEATAPCNSTLTIDDVLRQAAADAKFFAPMASAFVQEGRLGFVLSEPEKREILALATNVRPADADLSEALAALSVTPLSSLGLSPRLVASLNRAGFTSLADLKPVL